MPESALARLCQLYGVATRWTDIWGKSHMVEPAIQRALLRAMHLDADDDRACEATIAAEQKRRWQNPLPAVLVVREDGPFAIEVTLPQRATERALGWRLVSESGETHTGELDPQQAAVLGRHEIDTMRYVRQVFVLPHTPGPGYHRLELPDLGAGMSLIVAPQRCYWPAALTEPGRLWGPAAQLYAVRSRRNWGIGDFTDLRRLVARFAELGAGTVGVNPLHALFPHNPAHASPYSPSSRLFVNVLYIDVEAIPDFAQCAPAQQFVYAREFQKRLAELRAAELVDYPAVMAAKLPVLELLYQHFREHQLARDTERGRAFRAFLAEGGQTLERHALYEALQEHLSRKDAGVWGWPLWPAEYRDPDGPAVAQFAARARERVEFYAYLQWQADRQLAAVGRRSLELRLGVGLYQDLALSVDRAGAEAWADQALYAEGAAIGSPPDDFNLKGQNWGLPPMIPHRLHASGYAPFIATLRANMRHAGALRIDHIMGLMRLFWVPQGASGLDGAYVHYPFGDLLGILALESCRNRCLVVGEDLGTVPDEVRAAMRETGILSYRLFYFEKDAQGEFLPPPDCPQDALVAVGTHDLPTLAGYWKGEDLRERAELNLFPSDDSRSRQTLERAQDRARLLIALEREALLPANVTSDPASCPDMTPDLARAVHGFLARTPSRLLLVQLEDILGQLVQVNLPGTSGERPNWRRRLSLGLEDLVVDARTTTLAAMLREARGIGTVVEAQPREPGHVPAAIPRATYRLQFHREFRFADAERLVPYLARLGVSHIYASPYLKARPGSTHGYDIVDHNSLNPEIGTREDHERLARALGQHAMGQVLDIVPNHMGVGSDNAWWMDVLENGPASVHAEFFDIDWRPLKEELRGKVLLPVLGDHYGRVLASGELKLVFDPAQGAFTVHYYEHRFPVDPATYPQVLAFDLARLEATLGTEHPRFLAFQSLITALHKLPPRGSRSADQVIERNRDKEIHKRSLAEQCAVAPETRRHVEENVARFNATAAAAPCGRLHELLEMQAWRLAYWRTAADEINYRRFFDINDLAGLRMENPQVFFATHRLITELVAEGKLQGLRIDHPDGLNDPARYYHDLQSHVVAALAAGAARNGGSAMPSLYVVAEKILAAYERLPPDWPIHGTTGYDFANLVNGVFVYAPAERAMDRVYQRFVGRHVDFDELLYQRKRLIMRVSLSSELHVLANQLNRISEADPATRDFTLTALRGALTEVVACFPVYRTYVTGELVTADDRRYVDWAVAHAKKRSPAADVSIFDFIRSVLLLEDIAQRSPEHRAAIVSFAMRFQQYTAPVMAKGLEDTSFYCYHRLVSLNEVGGDPRRFGVSVAAFHHANLERGRHWPHAMLGTSTHDSKRSEDVRARLNVLSEIPQEWQRRVMHWSRLYRRKKRRLEGMAVPERGDEYLLYQTLVGAWPLEVPDETRLAAFRARIEGYMLKAVREAKVHTSWINPNAAYEEAVIEFVRALLASTTTPFVVDLAPFAQRVTRFGLYNSLSQVLLKLTAPGVPDLYQGNELWDFSLVDPDNRRPVDYGRRVAALEAIASELAPDASELASVARALLDTLEDGRAKLYLTWRLLSLRAAHADLFQHGQYLPLATSGATGEHVVAFARRDADETVVVAAPRWFARLPLAGEQPPLGPAIWADTVVQAPSTEAAVTYRNVLTGETLAPRAQQDGAVFDAASLFAHFPAAVLISSGR